MVWNCSGRACKAFTNGAILIASGRVPNVNIIFFIALNID
jgi:hypothetical protein